MKYLPLVWAGLWRKPVRSILTLLSVIAAFVLFGVLHGVTAGIDQLISGMSDTRLRIQSKVSLAEPLPMSYLARIESVKGVEGVGYYAWFGGYYQDPKNQISVGAVDVDRLHSMFPELNLKDEYAAAMRTTRNGALIGRDLAATRGWKIGDRIPLKSTVFLRKDGAPEWDFEIVGIYDFGDGKIPTNELWFNYAYFDEARTFGNGTVTLYFAKIADPSRSGPVSEAIDQLFANSTFETQTLNERDWLRGRIAQIGDMQFFVNAIVAAVLFTLLFVVTGFVMWQSVRERVPDLAVLKTYGFSNATIMALVLGEALLLCVVAAGIGVGIAAALSPMIYREIGAGGMSFPLSVVAAGMAIAALAAVVCSLPPARRVQTLNVVDALAGR
jgi:putative ABC transport system permease protein